jgi:hypothetical protein
MNIADEEKFHAMFVAELEKLEIKVTPRWIGGCRKIEVKLVDENGNVIISGIGHLK